jgi:bifunctional UDP-N-acetylglucosamine pyrophosphorylase/glucosamine-1-phosphate N-acetyltransferase
VAAARGSLDGFEGTALILSGDVPLLSPQTMLDFLAAHRQLETPLSVLTVALADPGMYGRVVRDEDGYLARIVEARDATPDELAIPEINTGIYAAETGLLYECLDDLTPENDQKEYYLTDVAAMIRERGHRAAAVLCPDPDEVMGINDRVDLAQAVDILRFRTNQSWMWAGVTMIDPQTTYIETAVKLSADVTLWPGVTILGKTKVGPGAVIGPDCWLKDAVIGADTNIMKGSVVDGGRVPDGETIGPMSVIGPD